MLETRRAGKQLQIFVVNVFCWNLLCAMVLTKLGQINKTNEDENVKSVVEAGLWLQQQLNSFEFIQNRWLFLLLAILK
jgi:hypothetical protein